MPLSRDSSNDFAGDDFDDRDDEGFDQGEDEGGGPNEHDDDALPEIECPSCGESIVEDTQKCPHCGEWIEADRMPLSTRPKGLFYILLVFVLIALILSWAI